MTFDQIVSIIREAGPVLGGAIIFLWGVVRLNGGLGSVRMRDDTTSAIESLKQRVQFLESKHETLERQVHQHESKIAVFDDRWLRANSE